MIFQKMIFNTYETLANRNMSEGAHVLLIYTADVVPLFIPMVLFTLFIILMLGTYFSSIRISGNGNLAASFAVAGFITTGASFILSLIPNLINPLTVVICIAVTLIGVLWLFFSRE